MGLFDSTSKTKNYVTYNTRTETNSEVGDIGLTGQNIVDLYEIAQQGQGDNYNRLIGGASELISASAFSVDRGFDSVDELSGRTASLGAYAFDTATYAFDTARSFALDAEESKIAAYESAESTSKNALQVARDIVLGDQSGASESLIKNLPLIAIVVVIGYVLVKKVL